MSEEPSTAPRPADPGGTTGWVTSLRGQLLLAIVVAAVVPLGVVAAVLYLLARWGLQGPAAVAVLCAVPLLTLLWLWIVDRSVRSRILGPIRRMRDGAYHIAEGEHGHRLDPEGPAELADLARSINRMAGSLIEQHELLAENVRSLEATNRALTEARDDLVHAEKLASVGRLAAGLAHEIGNPLNSILAYADVARRRGADPSWVEGVREEAERIDEIISGLLDFARPKEGEREAVDLNAVVRDTFDLLESQGRLRDVAVEKRLAPDLPPASANRARLKQVLVNLLLNACDAVEQGPDEAGRVRVTTAVEPFARPALGRVEPRREDDPETVDYSHLRRLAAPERQFRPPPFEEGEEVLVASIEDDGAGIDAEPVRKIFEPFFTTKEPGKGTGLGLAVAARLAHEMGGWIDVRNRDEGGSVFSVYFARQGEEGGA
ncbi:MAG: ATP-binding protein [Gemmatimonadota bacterium]|nr:ATP-binding protein [Gemmatimonadota bacterium]